MRARRHIVVRGLQFAGMRRVLDEKRLHIVAEVTKILAVVVGDLRS